MRPSLSCLVLLAAIASYQPCLALAQHGCSKIVSRKSDGRFTTFSLENFDEKSGVEPENRDSRSVEKRHVFHIHATLHRVQSAIRSTFLPAPPSDMDGSNSGNQLGTLRNSGYLSYILYNNIQDLSTSLRSVLATQRVLEGMGVGRPGATALSATLNFIIRDGCGMIASLLFTSYAAQSFRRNVKRWKFFADVIVNVGITLEIVAPSCFDGRWFLPLLCMGNVCKALCGVAAGACGGALQMYWAVKVMGTEEGISEVAAKEGAQRTVMGGAGLILAAFVAKWLGTVDVRTVIGLYCALTSIHLISNYKSLKLVALNWLNGWRLHLVVEEFLNCVSDVQGNIDGEIADRTVVLSDPMDASRKEPLTFLPEWTTMKQRRTNYPIRLGVSFNDFVHLSHQPPSLLQSAASKQLNQHEDNYILTVGRDKCSILVAFFSESKNAEKAKAYLHGCLVRRALTSSLDDRPGGEERAQKTEETAKSDLEILWPIFERCVADKGWILEKTECSTEGYKMHFE